jgi:hypothetical protein
MVQHLTIYTTEAKLKQSLVAHDRDNARQCRHFDFLTTRAT